jgi:hypothetical protein
MQSAHVLVSPKWNLWVKDEGLSISGTSEPSTAAADSKPLLQGLEF